MGWTGGTEIAKQAITVIQMEVGDNESRQKIYQVLLNALTQQDWDCVEESIGIDPVFDKVAEASGYSVQPEAEAQPDVESNDEDDEAEDEDDDF